MFGIKLSNPRSAILKSFSIPHDVAYSIEAVQEANLATRFNPLFWQCACLSVNAGSSMTNLGEDFGDAETAPDETDRSVTADYGKITRAIVQARNSGIDIELPDINRSESDFVPDVEHNAILFSLQSVSGVNAELVNTVVANRPYRSLEDFVQKVSPSRQQMFALLKAGCFDTLYPNKSRSLIVTHYLQMLADEHVSRRAKLTMANMALIEQLELFPSELDVPRRVLRFKKWEDDNEYIADEKRYKITHPSAVTFFESLFIPLMNPTDVGTVPGGYTVARKSFNKVANHYVDRIKEWLSTESTAELVFQAEKADYQKDLWEKYFSPVH